jgi:hypothetical protein
MDKSRAKASNAPRSSHERDRSYKGQPEDTHKKSDSILSVDTRRTLAAFDDEFDRFEYGVRGSLSEQMGYIFNPLQGANMQQEFDNLMRSDSTLKVSLTPDRLKTMEVFRSSCSAKTFLTRLDRFTTRRNYVEVQRQARQMFAMLSRTGLVARLRWLPRHR